MCSIDEHEQIAAIEVSKSLVAVSETFQQILLPKLMASKDIRLLALLPVSVTSPDKVEKVG